MGRATVRRKTIPDVRVLPESLEVRVFAMAAIVDIDVDGGRRALCRDGSWRARRLIEALLFKSPPNRFGVRTTRLPLEIRAAGICVHERGRPDPGCRCRSDWRRSQTRCSPNDEIDEVTRAKLANGQAGVIPATASINPEMRGRKDLLAGIPADIVDAAPGPACGHRPVVTPADPRRAERNPWKRLETVRRLRCRIIQDDGQTVAVAVREAEVRRVDAVP